MTTARRGKESGAPKEVLTVAVVNTASKTCKRGLQT